MYSNEHSLVYTMIRYFQKIFISLKDKPVFVDKTLKNFKNFKILRSSLAGIRFFHDLSISETVEDLFFA